MIIGRLPMMMDDAEQLRRWWPNQRDEIPSLTEFEPSVSEATKIFMPRG